MKIKELIIVFLILLAGCSQTGTPRVETNETLRITDERALKLIKIRDTVVPFFKLMRVQDGDWLRSFQESGQIFEEYLVSNPTLPTSERQTIYIQPIGNFTETQRKILQLTADYMKDFYNLPVKLQSEKN